MQEGIRFSEAKLEGGWLMLRPVKDDMGKAMSFVRNLKQKLYEAFLKEHRKKRSLDANAMAWSLINQIADALRIPPVEVYRQAIQDISGNNEIIPIKEEAVEQFKQAWSCHGIGWMCRDLGKSKIAGYRNLIVYYGSSVYDSKQMSDLINALVQDCKALGIEVLSEREKTLLLEEWEAKR